MTRKRLAAPALTTYDDADQALRRIGEIDRDLALAQAATDEAIDQIKQAHKEATEAKHAIKATLEAQLVAFAEARRIDFAELRSRELTFGVIGFRRSTSVLIKKVGDTLAALKQLGLAQCIRTKEEPDKEAMRELSTETLASCGAALKTVDACFYEIKREQIPVPVTVP